MWQGAFVLTEYLLRTQPREHWNGTKVVELGAGTGLVGIALAKLGAQVELPEETLALCQVGYFPCLRVKSRDRQKVRALLHSAECNRLLMLFRSLSQIWNIFSQFYAKML